jgi:hypothetical protein
MRIARLRAVSSISPTGSPQCCAKLRNFDATDVLVGAVLRAGPGLARDARLAPAHELDKAPGPCGVALELGCYRSG